MTLALNLEQLNNCQFPYTYTSTYFFKGSLIVKPSWINFDNTSRTYTMTLT